MPEYPAKTEMGHCLSLRWGIFFAHISTANGSLVVKLVVMELVLNVLNFR